MKLFKLGVIANVFVNRLQAIKEVDLRQIETGKILMVKAQI
jgi:hypothetical protein